MPAPDLAGRPAVAAPDGRRSLGGGELFALAFGAIIGASWIVLVGSWLELAGPVGATLAFAFGGLVALIVGFSYAELSSLYPEVGGELVFANRIFGPAAAHAVAWILLLLYLGIVALEAVSVSWIASAMFPWILGPTLYSVGGAKIHVGGVALGVAGSLAIAAVNYRGARSAGRLQDILTVGKIVVALVFVAFGLRAAHAANFVPLFGARTGRHAVSGFLVLMSSAPFFFAGFGVVTQAMGEAKPHEFARLGRILIAVVAASMAFYGCIIVTVAGLVPAPELAGYDLPAVQAFDAAFDSRLISNVVLSVGLFGLITVWNATFFAAVRVMEGMGEQGLVGARWLRRRDARRSPAIPVLLAMSVSLGAVLIGRTLILPVVSLGGLAVTLLFLVVCSGCLVRRRREPGVRAPFAAPGGVAMISAGIVLSALLTVASLIGLLTAPSHGIPPELIVLLVWATAGYFVWRSSAGRSKRHAKSRADLAPERPPQ